MANLIAGIAGVERVTIQANKATGVSDYAITMAEGTDIRRELFSRLAKRDWPLLASKSLAMTLEDIFINITVREDGGDR